LEFLRPGRGTEGLRPAVLRQGVLHPEDTRFRIATASSDQTPEAEQAGSPTRPNSTISYLYAIIKTNLNYEISDEVPLHGCGVTRPYPRPFDLYF
jgi:hypothetical protein